MVSAIQSGRYIKYSYKSFRGISNKHKGIEKPIRQKLTGEKNRDRLIERTDGEGEDVHERKQQAAREKPGKTGEGKGAAAGNSLA